MLCFYHTTQTNTEKSGNDFSCGNEFKYMTSITVKYSISCCICMYYVCMIIFLCSYFSYSYIKPQIRRDNKYYMLQEDINIQI